MCGMSTFVAIDFEAADRGKDSACAIGLVRVVDDRVVDRVFRLIRPPRPHFSRTPVHGITWGQVERAPSFGAIWPGLAPIVESAPFVAAHNAAFDREVLRTCVANAGYRPPDTPWECTEQLARRVWSFKKLSLDAICKELDIPLEHHDALSDAEACARIVIAARRARLV
jgi:DNA polymerase-3 subunit epsilon